MYNTLDSQCAKTNQIKWTHTSTNIEPLHSFAQLVHDEFKIDWAINCRHIWTKQFKIVFQLVKYWGFRLWLTTTGVYKYITRIQLYQHMYIYVWASVMANTFHSGLFSVFFFFHYSNRRFRLNVKQLLELYSNKVNCTLW